MSYQVQLSVRACCDSCAATTTLSVLLDVERFRDVQSNNLTLSPEELPAGWGYRRARLEEGVTTLLLECPPCRDLHEAGAPK